MNNFIEAITTECCFSIPLFFFFSLFSLLPGCKKCEPVWNDKILNPICCSGLETLCMSGGWGWGGLPPIRTRPILQLWPQFFHILISYQDYYNCTKKQPEIYVQYAKGGTYFVYIFCWSRALGRISPYENGTCFFHRRLLASKGDVWRQKVAQSSPSSYLGEGKKEKRKKTFFRGQENIWCAPPPPSIN